MIMQQRAMVSAAVVALLALSSCAAPTPELDVEAKADIQTLIERAIDRRNHQMVSGFSSTKEEITQDFVPDAVERTELEYGKLRQRRDALAPHGVFLTASGSEITLKELTVTDSGAAVELSEQTHLEHSPVSGVQGPDEGYVYGQKVDLAKTENGWKIVSIAPLNPIKPFPTTVIDPTTL